MPSWLIDLVTLAIVTAILLARPAVVLLGLVVLTVLVPATLVVPHTHSSYLTFQHVVLMAAVVRVLAMWRARQLPSGALAVTAAQAAFAVFVVIAFFLGVVFVVDTGTVGEAGYSLANLLDQLLFFTVCLALLRHARDPGLGLRAVAVAVVTGAAVAVGEHATGSSFGHWLFSKLPDQQRTDAATRLQPRAGQLRVRSGTEFALQWGWMVVMALPALIVTGLQLRRRLHWLVVAAVALVAAALYWSYTRSALAAVVPVLVIVVLLARNRRLTIAVVATFAVAAFAYAAAPSLGAHYNAQADEGSITIRFQRLAPILEAVSHHPFRGLGLGDLAHSGFATADNAFLLEYTELGAIGLTALVVLLIVALLQCTRAVAAAHGVGRTAAAAATAGAVGFVASAVFYDAFTLLQGARLFWVLVAVATVAGEQAGAPALLPHPPLRAVLAGAGAGLVLGGAAYALAPVHFAVETTFTTLPIGRETVLYDPVTAGTNLINTTCGIVKLQSAALAGASMDCRDLHTAAGMGAIRFAGGSRQELRTAAEAVEHAVREQAGISHYVDYAVGPVREGRASVWATAPGWAPLAAVELALTAPWRRFSWSRRRRRRDGRQRRPVHVTSPPQPSPTT